MQMECRISRVVLRLLMNYAIHFASKVAYYFHLYMHVFYLFLLTLALTGTHEYPI